MIDFVLEHTKPYEVGVTAEDHVSMEGPAVARRRGVY